MEQREIIYRPIDALILNPRNTRTHSEEQISQIADSIKEFGFTNPILISNEKVIIAGHARITAARKMGLKEVPTIMLAELTLEKIKALTIADNQLALKAGWDYDLLKIELEELKDLGFNIDLIGFGPDDLKLIFEEEQTGEVADDDFEPDDFDSIVTDITPGDLIELNNHRLFCGDSTNEEHVKKLLSDAKPFIMVTDPPYGVEYDSNWRLEAGINKAHQKLASGKVQNDNRCDWAETYKLFPGVVVYVWHDGKFASQFANDLEQASFDIRSQIIWSKPSLVMSRGHYHWQHEPCWYAVKKGGDSAKWSGDRKQSTIWQIQNMHRNKGSVDDGKTVHSTQKPVECMARPIRNHGEKEDAVYDPFLGSGTTLIGADALDRKCFGMEIEPKYCQVIIDRYKALCLKNQKEIKIVINGIQIE